MKRIIYTLCLLSIVVLTSCGGAKIQKAKAYKGIYEAKPLTVLLMPPINRSTNVEAKEFFHSTLNKPLDNAGYYVIPPFLSMAILKKESAYDSEMFMDGSLKKFGEVFGADVVLFTIINKWDKSALFSKVDVNVQYVIKSTKTNEILYDRTADITYDTSVSTGFALLDIAASAISTATTKYVEVARACNGYTLKDIPAGKYSPKYAKDGEEIAGDKEFSKSLSNGWN